MEKTRNSNIELLRILAMVMIFTGHYFGISAPASKLTSLVINTDTISAGNTGVCIFGLISGYFITNSKFKFNKLAKLIGQVLFYSLLTLVLSFFFNSITLGTKDIIKCFFPISSMSYWFASNYIFAYCFSPYVQKSINYLHQKPILHRNFIITCFVLFVVIGFITPNNVVVKELEWLIFLMYFGDYLRILDEKYHFSNKQLILAYLATTIVSFIYALVIQRVISVYPAFDTMGEHLTSRFGMATVIKGSCLLLLFSRLNIVSKYINTIASCTFAVYLIHQSYLKPFFFDTIMNIKDYANQWQIPHYLISMAMVFALAFIIDSLRKQTLEKLWLKILSKPCQKFDEVLDKE